MEKIYCAFDMFNCPIDKETKQEIHVCSKYGSNSCIKCDSRFDGARIKKYIDEHPRMD